MTKAWAKMNQQEREEERRWREGILPKPFPRIRQCSCENVLGEFQAACCETFSDDGFWSCATCGHSVSCHSHQD